jgi:hypothetical protein
LKEWRRVVCSQTNEVQSEEVRSRSHALLPFYYRVLAVSRRKFNLTWLFSTDEGDI